MVKDKYIIQINEKKRPFNVYLVLPLSVFKKTHLLLREEILNGRVDGDQQNNVILQLLLDNAKIRQLRKLFSSLDNSSPAKIEKIGRYYKNLIDKRNR